MSDQKLNQEIKEGFPLGLRLKMFLRTLALQASWNHERMQNLGLLVIMLPWLRRHPSDTWTVRLYCRRYYGFFNTNPYLANFLIGGLVRLETDRQNGVEILPGTIAMFRDSLGRTLASLGDQLFWLGLRPAIILAISIAAVYGQIIVILGLIALFAVGQLFLRWFALKKGFDLGMEIVDLVAHPIWHRSISAAKRSAMVLSGVLISVFLNGIFEGEGGPNAYLITIGLLLGIVLPIIARSRMPGEGLLLLSLVTSLLLAFAI